MPIHEPSSVHVRGVNKGLQMTKNRTKLNMKFAGQKQGILQPYMETNEHRQLLLTCLLNSAQPRHEKINPKPIKIKLEQRM